MHSMNCRRFKGEIENYLAKEKTIFESRIDHVFRMRNVKTKLNQVKIRKKEGYHAAHLLFILTLLPLLKISTIHSFYKKKWDQWSEARKDSFYRFKQTPSRWRSFMYQLLLTISKKLDFDKYPFKERYFIVDDSTLPKRGEKIQNVSFIYDNNQGRSVLGYSIVTLGLFTGRNFYPVDFAYRFGKTRNPRSPQEKIGNFRSISGRMSFEAKHQGKVQLALQMIQRAFDRGIQTEYVPFDSWYAWPSFIHAIRKIEPNVHVICRLKNTMVLHEYKGEKYRLSELYRKVKSAFRKDPRTALLLKRVTVKLPGSAEQAVIVFQKATMNSSRT